MHGQRSRILLADDHPMLLEGLTKLLSPDFEIVGAVADGRALLAAAETQRPELILVDLSMPGIDGIEATRRLRGLVPEARVLILSVHDEPSWIQAALEAGAHGYLTKVSAPEEIETAVREVLKGNFYISPLVTLAVLQKPARDLGDPLETARPAPPGALTGREVEIVRLVGKGLSNKKIAQQLGVSVTTVRTHLAKVYAKIGLVSRVELALFAAQSQEVVM